LNGVPLQFKHKFSTRGVNSYDHREFEREEEGSKRFESEKKKRKFTGSFFSSQQQITYQKLREDSRRFSSSSHLNLQVNS
jgi:hypothetical protein